MVLRDRLDGFLGIHQDEDKSAAKTNKHIDKSAAETNKRILLTYVFLAVGVGTIAILLHALQAQGFWAGATAFGIGIMFAGTSFLVGNLIGFLFGIPRALQHSTPTEGTAAGTKTTHEPSYVTNTNLEQISDWLTKILVGVGLTQLTKISDKVSELANAMGPALGDFKSSSAFAGAIFVYFVIFGFLVCYLWTRLYLQRALDDPLAALSNTIQQTQRDSEALATVDQQIDRAFDAKTVDQKVLVEAIKNSSEFVKARIFSRAQTLRSLHWENQKRIMERTIPIFRALIEIDTEEKYHRNHGQLGYALKDQQVPDYDKAKEALTTAINRRGPWKTEGWLYYEFNRAICSIKLDPQFNSVPPSASDAKMKEEILADLKAAASSEWIKEILVKEPSINKWMGLNGVDPNSL